MIISVNYVYAHLKNKILLVWLKVEYGSFIASLPILEV